jgi:hypothetical protein
LGHSQERKGKKKHASTFQENLSRRHFVFLNARQLVKEQIPIDNMHSKSIHKIVLMLYKMFGFLSIY